MRVTHKIYKYLQKESANVNNQIYLYISLSYEDYVLFYTNHIQGYYQAESNARENYARIIFKLF